MNKVQTIDHLAAEHGYRKGEGLEEYTLDQLRDLHQDEEIDISNTARHTTRHLHTVSSRSVQMLGVKRADREKVSV